jgi:hypothetical protein
VETRQPLPVKGSASGKKCRPQLLRISFWRLHPYTYRSEEFFKVKMKKNQLFTASMNPDPAR